MIVSNALVDVGGKAFEQLEFSDRVIELAIGWRHLVVATTRHIYSYHVDAFSTPNIFDIKGGAAIHLIHVAERFFVVVGAAAVGIRVYSYEGRELCAVKVQCVGDVDHVRPLLLTDPAEQQVPGLQTEYIKANSLAISPDAMAIVDRAKAGKSILFLDVSTGAPLSKPIACAEPAVTISLSQCGLPSDRKIAWVDANADLWISAIHNARPVKLGTLASSVQWNTDNDSLAAVIDTRLRVWHYPNVIFVDRYRWSTRARERSRDDDPWPGIWWSRPPRRSRKGSVAIRNWWSSPALAARFVAGTAHWWPLARRRTRRCCSP